MYKNLDRFVEALEAAGELVRIAAAVDPCLEIAEITDRMSKSPGGGKALLFENAGGQFPVLTNMMGSPGRMAMALGAESLDDISQRLESLLTQVSSPKEAFSDKLALLPLLAGASRWLPRKVRHIIRHKIRRRGKCQQVLLRGDEADLGKLPILKCWPHDGGRFVTLPLVTTVDPDTGARNVGMYRMQVMGPRTTGMHWHLHKTGERHYRAWAARGERMPVSVCIGGDPVYTYAATAPMPDGMDEWLLAGFLRRRSVKLVRCITNELWVPDDCDFVIEGYVDPTEPKFSEGPFGDHTGFYSLEDMYPRFHVTAITHRRGAIYPATLVGVPPQEDAYIAEATEKIFLPPIRLALQPEIEDMWMPPAGVAHNLALLSIRKSYQGQAQKVAAAMWGAGQMMFNKTMLILPSGVDLHDMDAVSRLVRSSAPARNLFFSRGVADILDHAVEETGVGGKVALDLTCCEQERELSIPGSFKLAGWIDFVDDYLARQWGILVIRCKPGMEPDASEFLEANDMGDIKYVALVDATTCGLSGGELLWYALANIDPVRDVSLHGGVAVVDARNKWPWREGYPRRVPNVVTSLPETIALVDSRWEEYGLGEFIESPSLRYGVLVNGEGASQG